MSSPTFYSELKRRKVIRVGTAYAFVGWILLQIGDVVFEPLGIPNWVQAALIYGVIALFPVILVLTWIYELTTRGLVRDLGSDEVGPSAESDRPVAIAVAPENVNLPEGDRRRLAVLPFVDLSGTNEHAHLAEGLSHEVIGEASRHTRLEVVARTSSFRFDGRDTDVGDVRERVGATHVLIGTVRRSESRISFSVQLIDTLDKVQIWGETYKRRTDDLFEAQADVARSIVRKLLEALELANTTIERDWAIGADAYEEYLLGSNCYRRANFPKAIKHAERSVSLEEDNPPALVLLADSYLNWTRYGFSMGRDEFVLARNYISKALAVDSDYLPARSSGGLISLFLDRDFPSAFAQVASAAEAQPELVEWLPVLLGYANRYEEAVELQRRMIRRDPLNPANLLSHVNHLTWIGGNDDEIATLMARARDLERDHMVLLNNEFRWAIHAGNLDRAERMMRRWGFDVKTLIAQPSTTIPPRNIGLWLGARLLYAKGERDDAYRMAQEIERATDVTPTLVAESYVSAGAIDDAYRMCDLGLRTYDVGIYDVARPHVTRNPEDANWLAFRNDARFEGFLVRLGIDDASLKDVDWDIVDRVIR